MKRQNRGFSFTGSQTKTRTRTSIFNPFGKMFHRIKSDPDKKAKSVRFGWISILFSILCVGLAAPCVWLGIKAIVWSFTTFLGFFTYFLGLGNLILGLLSLSIFLIPYYLWIHSVVLVGMQLSLNKKVIGWLALILWLASVVGIVWLSYSTFDTILTAAM